MHSLWDSAVTAAQQLHAEYLAESIRTALSSSVISGSNIDRNATPTPTATATSETSVGTAAGAGILRD